MAILHVFLLHAALLAPLCTRASIFAPQPFPLQPLSAFERQALRECPCADTSQCLPVDFAVTSDDGADYARDHKREVFAFSVTASDEWKYYDWEQLTTVAWNEDKALLCHAHSKRVKVVLKHNFDNVEQLCDEHIRQQWIQTTYERIVSNFADGVNIDTEQAMHGDSAACLTMLVRELRAELQQHAFTRHAQITFDVPWAPRGIDGRYYEWRALADASDFLFVMSYDMRSQIYYQCIASANSPLALVQQGLDEFVKSAGIAPHKLVLGVPWYGYKYACDASDGAFCTLKPSPFFGAPCSDAVGQQVDYRNIAALIARDQLPVHWDAMTQSPYVANADGSFQIWFDNPASLAHKVALVSDLGLRGVGMWNADTLAYNSTDAARALETQAMWQALQT